MKHRTYLQAWIENVKQHAPATAQDAITHLHASRDNIGASVVVFNTAGKPIMQVQISNALLSEPPPKQNLNLDYDAEQKNFTFQREGEDRSQCFRSIKAAIAQLSSYITAEAQLTVRDAEGKPVFFATLDPNAAGLAA